MRRRSPFVAILSLSICSCATQSEFRLLNQQVQTLKAQQELLAKQQREELNELKKSIELLRSQLADLLARVQTLEVNQQSLQGQGFRREEERNALLNRISSLESRLQELENRLAQREGVGSIGASGTDSSSLTLGEEELYASALTRFEGGDYDRSRELFQILLQRFPKGKYSINALFWLGEIEFRKKNYPEAIARYLEVIEKDPRHSKAPAAYLKMALSLKELKELERAKRTLNDLIRLYPESPQAEEAKKLLKRW
jgi:tol-pal system protein YbgF